MMATPTVGAVLADLKNRVGAIATALVLRNGAVVHAEMPEGSYADTFAVMCATVLGAAATASVEVGRALPERIVVEGRDSRLILVAAGSKALLVAAVDASADLRTIVDDLAKFAHLLETR